MHLWSDRKAQFPTMQRAQCQTWIYLGPKQPQQNGVDNIPNKVYFGASSCCNSLGIVGTPVQFSNFVLEEVDQDHAQQKRLRSSWTPQKLVWSTSRFRRWWLRSFWLRMRPEFVQTHVKTKKQFDSTWNKLTNLKQILVYQACVHLKGGHDWSPSLTASRKASSCD